MEPRGNPAETVSQMSSETDGRNQLQKRLERFKRRMNKRIESDVSGRTTPTSSIGGPPSEYGRALSTVSVPAFRHHTSGGGTAIGEGSAAAKDSSDKDAARIHLVKTLMQENETLKSTIDKWTPAVSAYRTCHALVQDLSKKVEEKELVISQLNTVLKDVEQRGNDSKLKLAEYERRMEVKDAALNQLKSKVIELKSQLETSQLAEAELKRQLGDRSRVLDQLQRGGNNPIQNQQQQAAMAMMTMQLQRDMSDCMSRLRQRDQEIGALTAERDSLVDACNQLQQALQAATTAAVVPISMEMSFKPPIPASSDKQIQTENVSPASHAFPSMAAHIQTDAFLLPNCSSISVQFSSIDLEPVVVNLDGYEERLPSAVNSAGLNPDNGAIKDLADHSVQCSFSDLVATADNYSQSDDISFRDSFVQSEETESRSVDCQTAVNLFNDMAIQATDIYEICSSGTDPACLEFAEVFTQTQVETETQPESSYTQTVCIDTNSVATDSADLVNSYGNMTQTETLQLSDAATDSAHPLFSLQDASVQSLKNDSHVDCQTDFVSVSDSQLSDNLTSVVSNDIGTSVDLVPFFQHAEVQTESLILLLDAATDAHHSLFALSDAASQLDSDLVLTAESSNVGCQAALGAGFHADRPESPTSESVMSVASDCFSSNLVMTGNFELKTPPSNICPTEMDALRAAVRLLSREKRDLQSKLAYLSKSGKANDVMRSMTPVSSLTSASPTPSRLMSASSPSPIASDGVHSSLSAIQRRITELREQLAAANHQAHS